MTARPVSALIACAAAALFSQPSRSQDFLPDIPDTSLARTYERAAGQNVLAAVNPNVFFGYFSVCADGHGFGFGNTYPSLDGHQMSDALLWLGRADVVRANWDYVRSFQRADGLLPLAILPASAGKDIGPKGFPGVVSANGGLYVHWVPGNPLEGLASPTYIQNADVIYRATLDTAWLMSQIHSINLAADYLASMTSDAGAVRGGGYYVERPPRLESDGVTQCYAVDAFRRAAALDRIAGEGSAAIRYEALAEKIRAHFVSKFWAGDHFAEYFNAAHGYIAGHGLTDVDWASIALDVATAEQASILWPRLRTEELFHYGGMPTGIATHPEKYEAWEFNYDRHDLAAMGRVWYLEAWARARMGDGAGLLAGLRKVSQVGRDSGYYWRERFEPDGKGGFKGTGPNMYCEYPANYIRIIQRFFFGVEYMLDGTVALSPAATDEFWGKGFGQTLRYRGSVLKYRMATGEVTGTYSGPLPQPLVLRYHPGPGTKQVTIAIAGPVKDTVRNLRLPPGNNPPIELTLPATVGRGICTFRVFPSGR